MTIRLVTFCFLLLSISGYSQEKEVFGRVVDSAGKPISGVIVHGVKHDSTAYANQLGYFKFLVPQKEDSLWLFHINFEAVTVPIPASNKLLVRLMEKVQQLPDLVLAVYLTPDVTIQSSNQNEGKLTLTEPTHGASPPLSLTSFYFEVTKQLLKDSVHKDLRDSTIITFSINIDGSVSFDELLPPNPRILDHLQKNKNEFSRWKNAIQNKIPVRQSFQFSVNLEEVEEIFFVAEESAHPHRGIADFYKFIGKSIRYPAEARRRGLEGKVFVEFIIDKDGTISEAKVVKGIGGGCDEEAIRVLLTSSPWMPGKQRGKPVKQRYTLPIIFSLSDSRY